MSSSILEQMRMNHEAIEGLEQHLSKELDKFPSGVRKYIMCSYLIYSIYLLINNSINNDYILYIL